MRCALTLLFAALSSLAAGTRAYAEPKPASTEASAYIDALESAGLIDKTTGTPERLRDATERANEALVAGQDRVAAALLYSVVEGRRFSDLSDSADFQDAEYLLGLSLKRGGAHASARRYLVRVLERGVHAPFFEPALRTYVDLLLEDRALESGRLELAKLGLSAATLDQALGGELAYLNGRAEFEAGTTTQAERDLSGVGKRSRFFAPAIYLRGLLRVGHGDLEGAKALFCLIAEVKEGDTLPFFIDNRYQSLRDLARLALGRIAHELGREDDAFYHYFLIPSDSPRLPEALFEAAWAALERKDYVLSAQVTEEYLKLATQSSRKLEATLLRATLEVKTCRFTAAERDFDTFLSRYVPLEHTLEQALKDPGALAALAARVLEHRVDDGSTAALLIQLLELDPLYADLAAMKHSLELQAVDAAHVNREWRAIDRKISTTSVQPVMVDDAAAHALLLERTLRLKAPAELSGDLALIGRRHALERKLWDAMSAHPPATPLKGSQLVELTGTDVAQANELERRAVALAEKIEVHQGSLLASSMAALKVRLDDLLRRARLGKIDAVVGQERKLGKQIEDLAAGRFPPEMLRKLHIEGLIADDEEYWPPEAEKWLDEYENYK